MNRTATLIIAAGAGVAVAMAGALAHSTATGVVKERMDLMEVMGDAMKSLTAMMRGEQEYDAERVRRLARTIGEHSGEALTRLFPEDSVHGPSEALPAIWDDWDRFAGLADRLGDYATALEEAAGNEHAGAVAMDGGTASAMEEGTAMMMGGGETAPNGAQLAGMPPHFAFQHLAETCSGCHQDFRREE